MNGSVIGEKAGLLSKKGSAFIAETAQYAIN
jgi:hypothetical protein